MSNIFRLETAREGSALLFVVIVTASMFVLIHGYYSKHVLQQDVITSRIQYEQHFRLTEGALRYGISYAKKHYNDLMRMHEYHMQLNEYVQLAGSNYTLDLDFYTQKDAVLIKVQLYLYNQILFQMQCRVVNKQDCMHVADWKIGAH